VIHALYVAAVAAALHPVFLTAAAVMLGAFGLSWLLRDVPLRETAGSAGIGESLAAPREASSEKELERILSAVVHGEARADFCRHALARSGLELAPEQAALLCRLGEHPRTTANELAGELDVRTERVVELERELQARGLVSDGTAPIDLTPAGRQARATLLKAGKAELIARYPRLLEGEAEIGSASHAETALGIVHPGGTQTHRLELGDNSAGNRHYIDLPVSKVEVLVDALAGNVRGQLSTTRGVGCRRAVAIHQLEGERS
jgi:DNA-binding MarR family transcriptional regulator